MDPETAAEQEGRPYVGPQANGSAPPHGEQAPPVHEPPQPSPQPLQELIARLESARGDIGGLISRTDQLEATVRRLDRQVLMSIGILAVVLYGVKHLAKQLQELDAGGV
jgi:hypothetical protein